MGRPKKFLVVDDEEANRDLLAARLAELGHDSLVAASGREALESLHPDVDLVLLDIMMPDLDGFEVARRIRSMPLYADLPIVMVTALSSKEDRLKAVAAGANDFITKPIDKVELRVRTNSLLQIKEAQDANKELLRGTLRGAIKVLSEVLALVRPEVYGRVARMIPYLRQVAGLLNESRQWSVETAARLSFLGFIVLPEPIIRRVSKGRQLSPEELNVYSQHAEVAVGLLANIPRMEPLIRIITYQEKRFDGTGWPEDEVKGEAIPLESRIIKAVSDFEALVSAGQPKAEALLELKRRAGWYDPQVLAALTLVLGGEASYAARSLGVYALKEGMILARDVFNLRGNRRLLARGQELSPTVLAFLKKYSQTLGVREPIEVLYPVKAQ